MITGQISPHAQHMQGLARRCRARRPRSERRAAGYMIRQIDAIAAGMQSPPPRAGDDLGAATHGDIPDCGLLVGLYIILGGWTVDTRDVATGWLCA